MKDFDAIWKENEQESIPFKLYGKEESIPQSVSAYLTFKMIELSKKAKNKDINGQLLLDMCHGIFTKKKTDEWLQNGLTMDQLNDLFMWAVEQYNPKTKAPKEKE